MNPVGKPDAGKRHVRFVAQMCDASHFATASPALQSAIETMERNMTDHVETPADRKAASVTLRELSEAELSTAAGGSTGAGAGKVTFNPFVITKTVDKSSPHLFL
jgi:hypothetical protein